VVGRAVGRCAVAPIFLWASLFGGPRTVVHLAVGPGAEAFLLFGFWLGVKEALSPCGSYGFLRLIVR
jgi:hypothetical protein